MSDHNKNKISSTTHQISFVRGLFSFVSHLFIIQMFTVLRQQIVSSKQGEDCTAIPGKNTTRLTVINAMQCEALALLEEVSRTRN